MEWNRKIRLIGLIDWLFPGALLVVALLAADAGPGAGIVSRPSGEIPLTLTAKAPNATKLHLVSTGEGLEGFPGRPARGSRHSDPERP